MNVLVGNIEIRVEFEFGTRVGAGVGDRLEVREDGVAIRKVGSVQSVFGEDYDICTLVLGLCNESFVRCDVLIHDGARFLHSDLKSFGGHGHKFQHRCSVVRVVPRPYLSGSKSKKHYAHYDMRSTRRHGVTSYLGQMGMNFRVHLHHLPVTEKCMVLVGRFRFSGKFKGSFLDKCADQDDHLKEKSSIL